MSMSFYYIYINIAIFDRVIIQFSFTYFKIPVDNFYLFLSKWIYLID